MSNPVAQTPPRFCVYCGVREDATDTKICGALPVNPHHNFVDAPTPATTAGEPLAQDWKYALDVLLQEITSGLRDDLLVELAAIRVVLRRENPAAPRIAEERIKVLINMWSDKRKGWLKRRIWDQKRTVARVKHLEDMLKKQRAEHSERTGSAHPDPTPQSRIEYFAGSVGPLHRLLKAIPVEVTQLGQNVIVWSPDIEVWGAGESLGEAMDNFGKTLPSLWNALHNYALGQHLQLIKARLETYMAMASVPQSSEPPKEPK
jgi:hypothetical protein